jgi:3-phenylpropionate/trans-cinnamate dioxygenase ferredoxin reductase component
VTTFVIAGAGLCGATAAATLRDEGYDGRLVLAGAEPLPPYERPPLSKEALRGEQATDFAMVRPGDWYREQQVELHTSDPIVALDPATRTVSLQTGERIAYDAVLLAPGVRNRRLDTPGVELPGVLELRTAADADEIRAAAATAARVLVVGMGFIGAEVAASLRTLGKDVTVIEVFHTALQRALGPEDGHAMEQMHRDHGVELLLSDTVERFEGSSRLEAVVTEAGRRIETELAVVGVGTLPNTHLAHSARIDIGANVGIAVDATLRTSAPDVFAAGDVADHDHPLFGRVRVEHYDNAIKMGVTAAKNMLGAGIVHDDPHWFWSDQYGSNLQVSGIETEWDRRIIRGDESERRYAAFYLDAGVLRRVVTLDYPREARRALKLIAAEARPDPAALADPEVDIRTLLREVGA